MADIVLQLLNLTKRYGRKTVLDNINLTLRSGRIYGFIGNNGAGKTTLMRIIMGLSFPNYGEISLFGEHGRKALEQQRARIGSVIGMPVFYGNMTARQNLHMRRMICRSKTLMDTEALLRLLKIDEDETGKSIMRNFSSGMIQRFGIAAALLGEPEFLLLDEPTVGVDPNGVRELREFFLSLNQEKGITIMLSSHILSELYRIATDYIFIHKGQIIQTITHEELQSRLENQDSEYLDDYFLKLTAQAEASR